MPLVCKAHQAAVAVLWHAQARARVESAVAFFARWVAALDARSTDMRCSACSAAWHELEWARRGRTVEQFTHSD
eukprot:720137-Alexandrium_andersonii.AAC.1